MRVFPRKIKTVVVKVGSSLVATEQRRPRTAYLRSLVQQITALRRRDIDVVLVSSGAIVLGMGEVDSSYRPSDLASLQALAAVGQTVLMRKYTDLFKKAGARCAQVLLTWDDFNDRKRFNNARKALSAMMAKAIVPVVNENDTIATDEIRFGDNDQLSALVASLVRADLLVILSDVEGLYDLNGKRKKVYQEVKEITREIEDVAGGPRNKQVSRGGMSAKLAAVKIATHSNIPCVITHGRLKEVLPRVVAAERIGTLFLEKEEKLLAKKHWISFGSRPRGALVVDEGAKKALLSGGKSLLLPGVVSWSGHFKKDDVVVVLDQARQEIARGIINYSVADLHQIEDRKGRPEAIHRDNLVLCQR